MLIGRRCALPRGRRIRFRVALAGTVQLDVLSIVIAERTSGEHGQSREPWAMMWWRPKAAVSAWQKVA
jgi:hypothetical protein